MSTDHNDDTGNSSVADANSSFVSVDTSVASVDTSIASVDTTPDKLITVDLRLLLKKHALGQGLLTSTSLDSSRRRLLVDILADDMIVQYGSPSKSVFLAYTKAITELFPQEKQATYFIPSSNQSTPYGKLYFKVVNLKHKRQKMGMKSKANGAPRNTSDSDFSALDDLDADAFEEMKNWLQLHQQPQSKLLDYWRRTAKRRLTAIHSPNSPSLDSILQQWPRYKDKDGFLLIAEDFSIMHEAASDKMASVWPRLWSSLNGRLMKLKVKDKHAASLLKYLTQSDMENPVSPEIQMTLTLILLPLLLSEAPFAVNSSERRRKRSVWKPSAVETMENFVDLQEPSTDLQRHLQAKSDALVNKSLKLQPHVVVLASGAEGLVMQQVGGYYACLHSDIFYRCASLMEAVDVCVKSTFVFGLMYPQAAHSSWTYLQRAVYGLSSNFDRLSSKVLELITDTAPQ